MVFGIVEEERLKWRHVTMKPEDIAWVEKAVSSLDDQPISTKLMEAVAA